MVLAIRQLTANTIIIINDGSRKECDKIFTSLEALPNVKVLCHAINLGKGRAIKTGFNYVLNRFKNCLGTITLDGDGQHLPEDVVKCATALRDAPDKLILGVRDFSQLDVPFKSRFGNQLTCKIFLALVHCHITDTQTGLRGIPVSFMKYLMNVPGERFEFETEMLLSAKDVKLPFQEVKIATVYLDGNLKTHFNPIRDSIKIYRVIIGRCVAQTFNFFISAIISAGIDISLFALFFHLVMPFLGLPRLLFSVATARVISTFYNYLMNRNWVFNKHGGICDTQSLFGYVLLCSTVLGAAYLLTKLGIWLQPRANVVLIKAGADGICFILSYYAQKLVVFRKKQPDIQQACLETEI